MGYKSFMENLEEESQSSFEKKALMENLRMGHVKPSKTLLILGKAAKAVTKLRISSQAR